MKIIGIIGAMDVEVDTLKERMTVEEIVTVASMNFYKGTYHQKNIIVVHCGIGKVNAAICAQILVDRFAVNTIINTGIAGSLQAFINIGDIVISQDAIQHDVDGCCFGYTPGTIPEMEVSDFNADKTLVSLAKEACAKVNPDICAHVGRIVSGDQFISDSSKKEYLKNTFGALCTEMEGAAIAHAAYLNQVPFVILRAISDKADGSAEMDYPEFEAKAAMHSLNLVDEMIKAL